MNVKLVKETDAQQFESSVNFAILTLQQQGMSEFTIQYQAVYSPNLANSYDAGGGTLTNGYVIYTALITYK